MNDTDFKVIKALTDLKLRTEEPLTPEQEEQFKGATDPDTQFLKDIERLFTRKEPVD